MSWIILTYVCTKYNDSYEYLIFPKYYECLKCYLFMIYIAFYKDQEYY